MVKIQVFAQLREEVGEKEIIINISQPQPIQKIIEKLIISKPELKPLLFINNEFSFEYQLMVNQQSWDYSKQDPLENSVSVAILPPVGGGININCG